MLPEKELIRREYQVREMRLTAETRLTKASLLRWLCLALGLLSPDESRQTVLPVLDAFLVFQLQERKNPTIAELAAKSGQPEKAVRYHMQRLGALGIAGEEKRRYFFIRDSASPRLSLAKSFEEHYAESLVKSLSPIHDALGELQRSYEG